MKKSIFFVINPIAGFRKDKTKYIDIIKKEFDDYRLEIYLTKQRKDAIRITGEAIASGFETVVAVGGDGTVNEVATGLCGTRSALGIIPMGSGNGLARSLKIPINFKKSLEVLKHGRLVQIDMGRAGHRHFCAVAGIGLDAIVGYRFDQTKWRGPLPYFIITAQEIFRYRPETCVLELEGQKMTCEPFLLTLANTQQFGNGAIIAPHAKCNDGYLDLCLVPNLPKHIIIASVPRLFNGTLASHPRITYKKVSKLVVKKSSQIRFHVDGEPDETSGELSFEVLPGALNVWASANWQA
ncbi:MAG: diacylglycerol kinase family lipid kinase [Calditrichaeota bacterium]|nr:MAG: diacylglycerol kinase family lipid kinase [Calditrichota bacterium]